MLQKLPPVNFVSVTAALAVVVTTSMAASNRQMAFITPVAGILDFFLMLWSFPNTNSAALLGFGCRSFLCKSGNYDTYAGDQDITFITGTN